MVDSNPGAIYWMDLTFFLHFIYCENCIVCLKRPKIMEKRPWLKKYFQHYRVAVVSVQAFHSDDPRSNPAEVNSCFKHTKIIYTTRTAKTSFP